MAFAQKGTLLSFDIDDLDGTFHRLIEKES